MKHGLAALLTCVCCGLTYGSETLYGACVSAAASDNGWYAVLGENISDSTTANTTTLYSGILSIAAALVRAVPADTGATDTIPPVIIFPETNAFTTSRPFIRCTITDETGPIDTGDISLFLDGSQEDRGTFSTRTIDSTSGLIRRVEIDYTPYNAPAGAHTLRIHVHDANPEYTPWPEASSFSFSIVKTESDPPQVTIHTPGYSVSSDGAFSFSISASDPGSGIQRVLFRYKVGGDRSFRVDTLAKDNGRYTKLFAAGSFSGKGFCFFVEVIDSAGNTTVVPDTSSDARNLCVRLAQGMSYAQGTGSAFPVDQWKMFSLPLDPGQPSLAAMLEPLLGNHDKRHWKLVRWLDNAYVPLADNASFNAEPGKAFFLYIRSKNVSFNPGPSTSVRIDRPYPIILPPNQWSQIGCPFAFPVRWNNFFATDSAKKATALSIPLADAFTDSGYALLDTNPVLYPWRGYWVFNPGAETCTLAVHPYEEKNLSRATAHADQEWAISLSCAPYSQAAFGTAQALRKNTPCPPVVHNAPYLYFEPRLLTCPTDQENTEGWTFPALIVDFNTNTSARLRPFFNGPAPEKTAIISEDFGYVHYLENGRPCYIDRPDQEQSVRLALVSGSASYVAQRVLALVAVFPKELDVGGNAPNPFNPATHFSLFLPVQTHPYEVRVTVHTVAGIQVQQLFYGHKKPGVHEITWNGCNGSGKPVSSGIYLYRVIVTGEKKGLLKTGKMALVR
ncbi:MAG: hypothetical protein A2268_00730 [Candidatus Raymondbacteria bacterium RifOxyA12_full_50_37]|nr:MAG: hypothetical protein A2268_00730 [Candidatus Raymondbacteria bacterium RifOxyA12_full_50_37]OGJ90054.1 MAG: hypothetical protein A2248_19060 [Candidatus Raymondbacteria bacterium RIFOXYA2_FULL_49_16]OGJ96738.1 MAG: hypothetical protein A2453_06185 [Candidatus Raymondbacteria bacterium RIFOXYC2_FULL_50_21]OGP42274.1 MAG: hypothetical protein A2324_01195 [Candidatus Raymondbacteria bacterium RIFOXYB2_FULL_49_35]